MQKNQENQGFDLQKNNEKAMPKHIRKKHRKKTSQKLIFTSLRASQNPSKTTKTRKKLGLERSLFCDAMETARESSEVNGTQRL